MAIDTFGSPTIAPPTNNGSEPRTIPTNAGVFITEIAADAVTQQAQQVQEASPQSQESGRQQQASNEPSQAQQAQAAPQREATADATDANETPVASRGSILNIVA